MLVGDHEKIYHAESTLKKAARVLPEVEAELVVDTGHLINMERPQFVDKRLFRFLSEQQTSGRTTVPN